MAQPTSGTLKRSEQKPRTVVTPAILTTEISYVAPNIVPRILVAERAMPLWADTEAPRKQAKVRPGSYSGDRSS